jgi:hypothetical protein
MRRVCTGAQLANFQGWSECTRKALLTAGRCAARARDLSRRQCLALVSWGTSTR